MAADTERTASFIFGADTDGLVGQLLVAQKATKDTTDSMSSAFKQVGGGLDKIIGTVGVLSGILAGGAAFKSVVSDTVNWDLSTGKLAKTLGVTTENASILKVELAHLGIDQDLVSAAALRMAKTMSSNSDAFKQLGVDVQKMQKDGKGNLEILTATIHAIGEYSSGLDRNQAAMTIFGRSWGELQALMKLSEEGFKKAEARARELHLIVGPEGVARAKEYKESLADLELVKTSLAHTAGTELVKALVEVGALMEGPATSAAHKFAVAVHELHLGIRDVVRDHGDFVNSIDHYASVQTINYMTLFLAAKAAMSGNYSMIPTILGVGYQSGKMSRDNDPNNDVDPQMQRAIYDKNNRGGHDKHFHPGGDAGNDAALQRGNEYIREYNRLQDERNRAAIQGNPLLSETEKKLAEIAQRYKDLIALYPENRVELEHNRNLDIQTVQNLEAVKKKLEEVKAAFDHSQSMAQIKHQGTLLDLTDKNDSRGTVMEQYNFEKKQAEDLLNWTLANTRQMEEQKARLLEEYRERRKLAEQKLKSDLQKIDGKADAAGQKFTGEGSGNSDLDRLNEERDAALKNWALMGKTYEEIEKRKTIVAQIYAERRTQIEQEEEIKKRILQLKYAQSALTVTENVLNGIATLTKGKNKEIFALQKAAQLGQATISAFLSYNQALANPPGPPYTIPMAQWALGIGLSNVAVMAATDIAGASGGGGSSSSAGAGYAGLTPSSQMVTQPAGGSTQPPGHLTINVTGDMYGEDKDRLAKWFEESLVPVWNGAVGRNVTINIPK